jgi:hypothetical protein
MAMLLQVPGDERGGNKPSFIPSAGKAAMTSASSTQQGRQRRKSEY